MKKSNLQLTTSQFAKLHEVNKRTLHYYDNIGLFSPNTKGDNGYRYYDISQSLDFEYIRMLKELNLSIEEIEAYCEKPTTDSFLTIADAKVEELDIQIQKLKATKKILQAKKSQLILCESLQNQEIRIEKHKAESILIFPYDFADGDTENIFAYLKDIWSIEQIRIGIGGFLSLDKVINGEFERYDGIYTLALHSDSSVQKITKPKGTYLCGYQKGAWDRLPYMYKKMIEYAKQNNLALTGYAFEIGLNEFAISDMADYVTKIMIKIEE